MAGGANLARKTCAHIFDGVIKAGYTEDPAIANTMKSWCTATMAPRGRAVPHELICAEEYLRRWMAHGPAERSAMLVVGSHDVANVHGIP